MLTPGGAGVPSYSGIEIQPLTRLECKSYYQLRDAKKISAELEMLTDEELAQILHKLPDEGCCNSTRYRLKVTWYNLVPVITYRYRSVHTGIAQIIPEIRINSYPDSVKTLENR